MRTVDDLVCAQIEQPETQVGRGLFDKLERRRALVIAITVALAFCARVYRLDAAGLAEDETNKIFAVRSYEQGDFTVNADHPMLMKMLCFASIHAARFWNLSVDGHARLTISEETALRLPNVTFGALTVVPLFLFTASLLGFRVALLTSLLWALGLNAVWINRVVKEDTLLVFFIFTGFYFYNRAKNCPAADARGQERFYTLAGAAFGLMVASKYFPHYLGLNQLFYTLVGYDSRNNRPLSRRMWFKFFGMILLAFVAFNWAAFVPQTWRYLSQFVSSKLITHHGYLVMDRLYMNDMTHTPDGNVWYFYFLFLAVKLPLPVLAAFLVGLVEILRRRGPYPDSRGYLFLRMMLVFWLLPWAIAGSKFLRYTLALMPLIYMTAAIGVMAMWRIVSAVLAKKPFKTDFAHHAAAVTLAAVFVVAPAAITIKNLPYPSLYLNLFGGDRVGYFFPHDEFYDLGARESIKYVAETAPPGATLASEIPGVVQYYLEKYNRPDIRSKIISHPKFNFAEDPPDYMLLQRGRTYLENREDFALVESKFSPEQASSYFGADAARVYRTRLPIFNPQ